MHSCCGAHHSHHSSLYDTLRSSRTNLVQTYLGSSKDYRVIVPNEAEIEACNTLGKRCVIHSKLVTNLAIHNCVTLHVVEKELIVANQLQDSTVVMHIGNLKQEGSIDTLTNNINSLRHLLPYHNKKLCLEIAAGKGNDIGWNEEQLHKIWEALDRNIVGLCFDTQHGFASGMTPLQRTEDIDYTMNLFYNNTGQLPTVIHLNDSKVPSGSRKDVHAAIGSGYIWPRYNSESYFGATNLGLVRLKQYSERYNIPVISESPEPLQDVMLWDSIAYVVAGNR